MQWLFANFIDLLKALFWADFDIWNNCAIAASGNSAASEIAKDLSTATDSGLSSSISSTDSDTIRSKNHDTSEKNSSNSNSTSSGTSNGNVILKKVFKPRLSKNAEQIEALLRRINAENKKTKEVLDNISQAGELNSSGSAGPAQGPAQPKNPNSQGFYGGFNKKLVDPQDLIDPEEDEKTKNLVNAVIPPIRTAIIEKTSTTFLGMP